MVSELRDHCPAKQRTYLILSRVLSKAHEVELVGPKERIGEDVPAALGAKVRLAGVSEVGEGRLNGGEGLGDEVGAGGRFQGFCFGFLLDRAVTERKG